jgi:hypothetical protein
MRMSLCLYLDADFRSLVRETLYDHAALVGKAKLQAWSYRHCWSQFQARSLLQTQHQPLNGQAAAPLEHVEPVVSEKPAASLEPAAELETCLGRE